MKSYLIQVDRKGTISVIAEDNQAGEKHNQYVKGPLTIGTEEPIALALARAIMEHYYGASKADPSAQAEADRYAGSFMNAFLLTHKMKPSSRYEISGEIIDNWIAKLQTVP